jgi:hypothetical protein
VIICFPYRSCSAAGYHSPYMCLLQEGLCSVPDLPNFWAFSFVMTFLGTSMVLLSNCWEIKYGCFYDFQFNEAIGPKVLVDGLLCLCLFLHAINFWGSFCCSKAFGPGTCRQILHFVQRAHCLINSTCFSFIHSICWRPVNLFANILSISGPLVTFMSMRREAER